MRNTKMDLLLSKDEVSEKMNISVYKRAYREDLDHGIHRHNYLEIEFIVDGSGTQNLNGEMQTIENGTVYLMRPSDFHCSSITPGTVYYNISFSEYSINKKFLNSLIAYGASIQTTLKHSDYTIMCDLCHAMLTEFQNPKASVKILQNLLDCVLINIFKSVDVTSSFESIAKEPMQTAITYVQMHFIDNPPLKTVAEIAHYNPSHFSTFFHQQMKTTYSEYLNSLKINYAKSLLITTDFKVNEICTKCGFHSQANFLRVFKAMTGLSPHKYRNMNRN